MDNMEDDSLAAGAYYSRDFDWEALRDEVERMPEFSDHHGHSVVNPHQCLASFGKGCASPASWRTVEGDPDARTPSTSTSWEAFHTRHSRNLFFKERRYLTKEFPDLGRADEPLVLLEVGCGTGSSVVPIMRANKQAVVYGCDCSPAALKKASEVVSTASDPCSASAFHPFLCDVATSNLPEFLSCSSCRQKSGGLTSPPECCIGGVDIVTMIFTLSAIPVETMAHVVSECLEVLKPGGLLLFRDYGLYDMTMMRFSPRQRVSGCLYQRDDGTLSYFFSLEAVRTLFTRAGFLERELEYCCVQLVNRRKHVPMKRVWVHAKFQKPE